MPSQASGGPHCGPRLHPAARKCPRSRRRSLSRPGTSARTVYAATTRPSRSPILSQTEERRRGSRPAEGGREAARSGLVRVPVLSDNFVSGNVNTLARPVPARRIVKPALSHSNRTACTYALLSNFLEFHFHLHY